LQCSSPIGGSPVFKAYRPGGVAMISIVLAFGTVAALTVLL